MFQSCLFQEIDELLAGGLTDEDESEVLDELNQIIMVQHFLFPLD